MNTNFDFIFKLIASIASVLVIISSFGKGFAAFKKWREKRKLKLSRTYSGNWDNQGQIRNKPSHYIDLVGWNSGKEYEGRFNVRKSNDENSWEMFKIVSKASLKNLKCKIFKVVDDQEILVASGIMRKDKNGLRLVLDESSTDQSPKEAFLRRGLPTIG